MEVLVKDSLCLIDSAKHTISGRFHIPNIPSPVGFHRGCRTTENIRPLLARRSSDRISSSALPLEEELIGEADSLDTRTDDGTIDEEAFDSQVMILGTKQKPVKLELVSSPNPYGHQNAPWLCIVQDGQPTSIGQVEDCWFEAMQRGTIEPIGTSLVPSV